MRRVRFIFNSRSSSARFPFIFDLFPGNSPIQIARNGITYVEHRAFNCWWRFLNRMHFPLHKPYQRIRNGKRFFVGLAVVGKSTFHPVSWRWLAEFSFQIVMNKKTWLSSEPKKKKKKKLQKVKWKCHFIFVRCMFTWKFYLNYCIQMVTKECLSNFTS